MHKKLYRSRENKIIAGVLSGLAEYFEHDPTLWRVGFLVVLFLTGLMPFLLVYAILWIVVPERPVIEPVRESDHTVSQDE